MRPSGVFSLQQQRIGRIEILLATALTVAIAAPGPVQAVEHVDVAYDELAIGENTVAIRRIEGNDVLEANDPSRLINLGVAYAREGDIEKARALFRAALFSNDRQLVETSAGEWVDSRILARRALARLENSEATRYAQVALSGSK